MTLLISSISTYFYILLLFPRVCQQKIAPPLPKQVRFKNANRTRKLENRIVSFFFSKGVHNRSFHPSDRIRDDLMTKKITFFGFSWILQFLGAPEPTFPRIPWILDPCLRILTHFEARPKDFKAFWSRPGFILLVLFVYFYLYLFVSFDFC